jgi:SAM-dependent methyltransferase
MKSNKSTGFDPYEGWEDIYDAHRPRTPAVILDILRGYAHTRRPGLVVDLGCGTGLSTFVWVGCADAVVGIEAGDCIRRIAEAYLAEMDKVQNIRIHERKASETGLPDECADIVTCSQSFHWMEPESTLAEVHRILRKGGVFAVYDYGRLPTINKALEGELAHFWAHAEKLRHRLPRRSRWNKAEHLEPFISSGYFQYVKECWVHNQKMGDAERLIGYARSFGGVGTLLEQGTSEVELGYDTLREMAGKLLGDDAIPWYFSYSLRIAIK